jgi:Oxidoreductase family, NAD-binding Rossmann fold
MAGVAAKFGVKGVFTDYDDLLATPGLEAVSIATPPAQHHEMAIAAIRAGKHIICEKPFAPNVAQANEMAAAAAASKVTAMVAHEFRFSSGRMRVQQLLAEGYLGQPKVVPPALAPGSRPHHNQASTMRRTGCDHCTSRPAPASLWITGPTRCSRCTSRRERGATIAPTGCNRRSHGVQPLHPNRPANHPRNRPPPPDARQAPVAGAADGGTPAEKYFAALGDGWQLTAAQRARLAPAAELALSTGWTPAALAAFTGANTSGVRSAYGVLAARLSPAELPRPPGRPARPPWCGECDQVTWMRGFDGDAPRPCPRCKQAACTPKDQPGPHGPHRLDRPHTPQASMGAGAGLGTRSPARLRRGPPGLS